MCEKQDVIRPFSIIIFLASCLGNVVKLTETEELWVTPTGALEPANGLRSNQQFLPSHWMEWSWLQICPKCSLLAKDPSNLLSLLQNIPYTNEHNKESRSYLSWYVTNIPRSTLGRKNKDIIPIQVRHRSSRTKKQNHYLSNCRIPSGKDTSFILSKPFYLRAKGLTKPHCPVTNRISWLHLHM